MIAVQPVSQNSMWSAPSHSTAAIEPVRAHAGRSPADEPARVIADFQPLDPGIVSDTIPAFFIGRNKEGFWVARDAHGQIGGIFLLETSALSFARQNSQPAGCATIFPFERFELDLKNSGNPLVTPLRPFIRLLQRYRRRMAALAGKMTDAVKGRLDAFLDR